MTGHYITDSLGKSDRLTVDLDAVRRKNEQLQIQLQSQLPIPDYGDVRDRYLASLKLGSQAPEYKKARKHIDGFIGELLK